MKGKPEVYLFDFWQTLGTSLSEDPIATFARQLGVDLSDPGVNADFMKACLTINVSRPKRFVDRICRQFGVVPTKETYELFRALVRNERSNLKMYEDTRVALAALKKAGCRMGIVSNLWPFPVKAIFNRHKLASYFEHTVFSFEVGARKPDRAIFLEACSRFNVEPDRCVMIGDSLSSDIAGANGVGMPAAVIVRSGEVPAAIPLGVTVIRSLMELYA
jgi:HAD superfamily hydrolase (TIGR01662 family)